MAKNGKGKANGVVKNSLAAAAKKIAKTLTKAVTPKGMKKTPEKTPSSPVSTSSSLSDLRDKLLGATPTRWHVDPYGLLPGNLANPGSSSAKASSARGLSFADQQLSAGDQEKIRAYQNLYDTAKSDADRRMWHNAANQVRGKYGYISTNGDKYIPLRKELVASSDGDGIFKTKTSLSGADRKLPQREQLVIQTDQFGYDNATNDEERKHYHDAANEVREKYGYTSTDGSDYANLLITRYDDPTVGRGSYLDKDSREKSHAEAMAAQHPGMKNPYEELENEVKFILDNESRLKNPADAAAYVAYITGFNDDTKAFLLRTYGAAQGEDKLRILNGILSSAGWTRETESLYDNLSAEEQQQLDKERVSGLSKPGDYSKGKEVLDQYYRQLAKSRGNEYVKEWWQTQDFGLGERLGYAWTLNLGKSVVDTAHGLYRFGLHLPGQKEVSERWGSGDPEKDDPVYAALTKAQNSINDEIGLLYTDSGPEDRFALDLASAAGSLTTDLPLYLFGGGEAKTIFGIAGRAGRMLKGTEAAAGAAKIAKGAEAAAGAAKLERGAELALSAANAGKIGDIAKSSLEIAKQFAKTGRQAKAAATRTYFTADHILQSLPSSVKSAVFAKRAAYYTATRYDEALDAGANPAEATVSALTYALPQAVVESMGGMDMILSKFARPGAAPLKVISSVLQGALSEGVENSVQQIWQSGSKALYGGDIPLYSDKDGVEAWINPTMIKESAYLGAILGGVLSGVAAVGSGGAYLHVQKGDVTVLNDIENQVRQHLERGIIGPKEAGHLLHEVKQVGAVFDVTQTGGAQKAWGKIGDYVSDGTLTRSQGHSLWQLVSAAAVRKDDGLPTSAEGTEQGGYGLLSAEGEQVSTGKTPAADSMGVASSGREAIAELKDMAVSRKEGNRISVAFRQDGKTVVYDASVNAYGNLGLISQRDATSKEAAALKEKLDTSGETGLIRIPGGKQGKANNELQLPLPLTSRGMDGTLKLPGDKAFYDGLVGGRQEDGRGKGLSESAESEIKFSEMTPDEAMKIAHEYRMKAPIQIPEEAKAIPKSMNAGYEQITYNWYHNGYKYEVRWHTRTPGAPESQGNTWVIKREIPGNGGQKPRSFYKIGNTGTDTDWIKGMDWFDAIRARDTGKATQKQIEILNMGHWKE